MEWERVYKEILDLQNSAVERYNSYLKLSHTNKVRDEFLKLLSMEHKISDDIFKDGEKRGIFKTDLAKPDEIQRVKQSF